MYGMRINHYFISLVFVPRYFVLRTIYCFFILNFKVGPHVSNVTENKNHVNKLPLKRYKLKLYHYIGKMPKVGSLNLGRLDRKTDIINWFLIDQV